MGLIVLQQFLVGLRNQVKLLLSGVLQEFLLQVVNCRVHFLESLVGARALLGLFRKLYGARIDRIVQLDELLDGRLNGEVLKQVTHFQGFVGHRTGVVLGNPLVNRSLFKKMPVF